MGQDQTNTLGPELDIFELSLTTLVDDVCPQLLGVADALGDVSEQELQHCMPPEPMNEGSEDALPEWLTVHEIVDSVLEGLEQEYRAKDGHCRADGLVGVPPDVWIWPIEKVVKEHDHEDGAHECRRDAACYG